MRRQQTHIHTCLQEDLDSEYIGNCSLKPYKIKGKTVTPNAVDSAGVACLLR